MPMVIELRAVTDGDLCTFFEQERDPVAVQMAAFTPKDPSDETAFTAHWAKIRANPGITMRTILANGVVAGKVMCYPQDGTMEVTYWIGREHWGQGIATRALSAFIAELAVRPLRARVAADNLASLRVLQKCGFTITGQDRGFANARGAEIDELVLSLCDATRREGSSA
jgi:RimJ/RimL family protein N-acetyltransferase